MRRRAAVVGVLAAAAISACRSSAPSAPPPSARVVLDGASGAVSVRVEVARTPEAQQRGLMYRRELAPDAGMIFVFAEERPHAFWMRNTYLPLDLVFIGEDGAVRAIVERAPLGEQADDGGVTSRYVLEVNRGFCREHGVKPGAKVRFEGVLY